MKTMTESEWRSFLSFGTRTAKLASRRPDGRPHVAPIWFVLDANDLVFTTHSDSVKGKNLRHDPRVMLAVDDEQPPFAFVLVEGSATLSDLSPPELLPWTTRIAMRYMGADQADAYDKIITEADPEARTTLRELARDQLTRSAVILKYVLMDEFLSGVMCWHYFGKKRGFPDLWKTKRFKSFNYFILEKLYLLQKLDL